MLGEPLKNVGTPGMAQHLYFNNPVGALTANYHPNEFLHFELSRCQTKDSADRKLAEAQLILDYNPEFNSRGQWKLFFFFLKMP